MFPPFGDRVDLAQRQPRFVREVPLEQPVRAHDLQREPLAGRRQRELLTVRGDQTLGLHAADERDDGRVREMERAGQ